MKEPSTRLLIYETAAFLLVAPIIVFALVIPLLNMALTAANYLALVLLVLIAVEGGFIGHKLFKFWERKVNNE